MEIGVKVKFFWNCMAGRIVRSGTVSRKYSDTRYEIRTESGWSTVNIEDIIEISE